MTLAGTNWTILDHEQNGGIVEVVWNVGVPDGI